MNAIAATIELPLYLQMSRYTKGSTAVMELRTERFLEAQRESQVIANLDPDTASDDTIITGSIDTSDADETSNGFSLDDFLDTINPLQHLPVISTLYRELTGDQIAPAARIVGGAVYGGPVGAGIALADSILEQASGATSGAHMMSWFKGSETDEITLAQANENQARAIVPDPRREIRENSQVPTNRVPNFAGVPNMSAETFQALLTPPNLEGLTLKDEVSIEEEESLVPPTGNSSEPVDISAAMSAALDLYVASQENRAP
jgi:hypothetical protein